MNAELVRNYTKLTRKFSWTFFQRNPLESFHQTKDLELQNQCSQSSGE
jgi:hypothetical protein